MLPAVTTTHLSHFPHEQIKRAVLTGPSGGVFGLCHDWMFYLQECGYQIFTIDCAIRFHVFRLAERAMSAGIPVEETLEKIRVQRAFTPYQILDSLHEVRQQQCSQTVVFLLAPFKQFFDGDVADDEAEYLLGKLNRLIQSFETPVLVAEKDSYKHPAFEHAYQTLIDHSQIRWFVKTAQPAIRAYSGTDRRTGKPRGAFIVCTETQPRQQITQVQNQEHQNGKNSSTILSTGPGHRRKIQRIQTGVA